MIRPLRLSTSNFPRFLLGIVVLAVALRLAVGLVEPMSTRSDAGEYLAMARNVVEGNGLVDRLGNRAYYCAGYPLLLAAVFLVTGPKLGAVLVVNLVLAVVSVFLVHRVARCAATGHAREKDDRTPCTEQPAGCFAEKRRASVLPEWAGLLAAFAWAVYVPSVAMANAINKENLLIPLMLGMVWLAFDWPGSARRIALAALAGLLAGVTAIVAATGSVTAGSVAAVVLVHGTGWRQRLGAAGAFLLTAGAVVAPWLYRNYLVFGEPVLKTNSGFVFYMGNNPAATGGYVSIGDTPLAGEWNLLKAEKGELAADREASRRARQYIREHPGRTLWMFAKKAVLFWEPPYLSGKGPEPFAKRALRYIWFAQYLALIGLALAGLRDIRRTWPLYLAIALFAGIHLPFVSMLRYRLPVMALICCTIGVRCQVLGARCWVEDGS